MVPKTWVSRRRVLPLCCVFSMLMGCDDEPTPGAPVADMEVAIQPDATPTPIDAGIDAAVQCAEPVDCPARERQVGCECLHVDNRRCLTAADCRPTERCEPFDDIRVCIFDPPPVRRCPGVDCPRNEDPILYAGAASRVITPPGFETPTEAGLNGVNIAFADPFPEGAWNDCGLDGLCEGDPNYPGPDSGEGDGLMQGMWLAGFSSSRPAQYCPEDRIGCDAVDCCISRFAHDDLTVQVTVIRQQGVTVALGAVDAVGYFHSDIERIRKRVEPMGVDLLVMGATHNHEAPDTSGQWGPGAAIPTQTGRDPAHMQRIEDQTVSAIAEAIETLRPARLEAGVLDVGVDGLAVADSRTPYIFNDDVPVVRLRARDDGAPIATLLSFGNHAEVLWAGNTLLTADYPHYVRKYIREGLPEVTDGEGNGIKPALSGTGGVVVFFAGSVGGLIYPGRGGALDYAGIAPEDDHSFAAADAVGQTLASHVLGGIEDGRISEVETGEGLRFASKQFLVPADNELLRLASLAFDLIRRDIYNSANMLGLFTPGLPRLLTEVAIVRLGPISFFTAPGEVFPETLCGGFPNRDRVRTPVVGDVQGHHTPATCSEQGLPMDGGEHPCIVKADANNPPDWDNAPEGPYVYELIPGETPFFIGLGMDFLGYIVPEYDFVGSGLGAEPPGDHYEETNSMGPSILGKWRQNLEAVIEAVDGSLP